MPRTCLSCGGPNERPRALYCSHECSPSQWFPCAECGTRMWKAKTSLPQGRAKCRPCRNIASAVTYNFTCEWCSSSFASPAKKGPRRYCTTACAARAGNAARSFRSPDDADVTRKMRERAAPGLTQTQRLGLLAQWRAQGRSCSYCTNPVQSVDHVVPLIRGGTNWEGNLTPACGSCNSRKGPWLLMEWRTGRRCTPVNYMLALAA